MRPKPVKFKRLLIFGRDAYTCGLCGQVFQDGQLVPHHRANRGHGGSPMSDRPSNILSLCGLCNGLIESDPVSAETARHLGIKISRHDAQIAHLKPVKVFVESEREWVLLDDSYGATLTQDPDEGLSE
jgi:5-methylcytosine-specific restriction endonuclease McrA